MNGDVYEGDWQNDEKQGNGVMTYSKESKFIGYYNKN
jgi:hypothetical protein